MIETDSPVILDQDVKNLLGFIMNRGEVIVVFVVAIFLILIRKLGVRFSRKKLNGKVRPS